MMEAYEEYKDSGVEWLGDIPAGWELRRNKLIFEEKTKAVGKDAKKFKLLSLTLGGVIPRDMENPKGKFPAQFDTYKQVNTNDLVFCLFDVEETPRAVGIAGEAGMITGAYTVLKTNPDTNPSFVNYLYLSIDNGKQLRSLYTGLRNVIKIDTFMSIETPFPDSGTQTAIANFLDDKTAKIEALVGIKRRQIALLVERKQILIQNAVTKGLNPDAPMKDSGVDWIGEIPVGWEVRRLKNLIQNLESGVSVNASESEVATDDEIGVLKTSAVYEYIFDHKQNKKVFKSDLKRVSCPVEKGRIIISRMNAPGLVGASGYVEKSYPNLFLPDRLWQTVFSANFEMIPKWLSINLVTKGFRGCIETIVTGTSPSMKNISKGGFLDLWIAVPTLKEQRDIVQFIEILTRKSDAVITIKQNQITKLNEYKVTLINAAVTGKIKVA